MHSCRARCALNDAGAIYHVMSRGDQAANFPHEWDRHDFLKTLGRP